MIEEKLSINDHWGQRLLKKIEKIAGFMSCYDKDLKMQTIGVKVYIVPLNWINDSEDTVKIMSLLPILETINDEKLYTTPFIEALKEVVITLNKEAFNWCFVPFLIQLINCITYFSFFVMGENSERTVVSSILELFVLVTTALFTFIEFKQMNA